MQIVIDNYFKLECDVNTSIRSAYEKGFRTGVRKGLAVRPILEQEMWTPEPKQKKGKWIPTQNPQWKAYHHDKCSVCGWWNTKNAVCRDSKKKAHSLNYCPNCGVRMVKEGEEHD